MPWFSAALPNSVCQEIPPPRPVLLLVLSLVHGRSVTCIESTTTKLVSESAASAYRGHSFCKAGGQVGGPSCPSGAPRMSVCLSMGLGDHMHKAACKRRISSINGSRHKFGKRLSFLFKNAVKTSEKRGTGFLLLGCSVVWRLGFV